MNFDAAAAEIITCPDCSAPHSLNLGKVCGICGYNFTTGAHGEIPYPLQPKNITSGQKTTSYSSSWADYAQEELEEDSTMDLSDQNKSSSTHQNTWELVTIIDPALCKPESPEPPINQPPLVFRLNKEINLIGRYSQKKGVEPEISLDFDDAISHRHAQIIFQPDGTLLIRDIGSSNGTQLNGVMLPAMNSQPLKDGDQLILGHWTKIIVRLR